MGQDKVMKVVIDTNVLISALLFGGTPGKLIPLWQKGDIKMQTSKEMVDEYIKVLSYPKFELSKAEITYLLQGEILPYLDVIAPTSTSESILIKEDPSDDKFIYCAESGNAKCIITGDHHLLKLKAHEDIKILTPLQFLENF